jgi:hypothetical protein
VLFERGGWWCRGDAYCVCTGVFLLCSDDGTLSLGGVDGGIAFDDSFSIDGSTSGASLAANLGDTIPVLVAHGCGS